MSAAMARSDLFGVAATALAARSLARTYGAPQSQDACVPMNPHARLAAMADSLRAGTLGSEDREQFADTIDRIANGEDAAAALGLKRSPGQRKWRTCAALAERDRLLRDAAARYVDLSVTEQAMLLHRELSRYHATAWQRERTYEDCPDPHLGTIHEFLWRALKVHDHVLAARSLRLVLARS
jgi:hypothetical protein